MVDRNICRLAYEDNEDEYDDFYDYDALDAKLAEQSALLSPFCSSRGVVDPNPCHLLLSFRAHGNTCCFYCRDHSSLISWNFLIP